MLALLVTRELTFETREGRKEALDGPPDPCLVLSHCILPSPARLLQGADSEGTWQISAQESGTNCLRPVFEWRGWWSQTGRYLHTSWGIVCLG